MELIMAYNWPGNVRELENIVERAMIVSDGDTLKVEGTWLVGAEHQDASVVAHTNQSLAAIERQVILETLKRTGGKIYGANGAATILGVKPTTLYGKMRKHKIKGSRSIKHEVSPR